MLVNTSRPPLDDVRIRRALAYAIDKQALVDKNTGGSAVVAWADQPPFQWSYTDDVMKYPADAAKSRALLAEAGYTPGPDGIMRKNGKPLSFTLSYNVENATRRLVAVQVQAMLKAVGHRRADQDISRQPAVRHVRPRRNSDHRQVRPQHLRLDRGTGSGRPLRVRERPDPEAVASRRRELLALRRTKRWTPSKRPRSRATTRRARKPALRRRSSSCSRAICRSSTSGSRARRSRSAPDFKNFAPNPVNESWNAYQWEI